MYSFPVGVEDDVGFVEVVALVGLLVADVPADVGAMLVWLVPALVPAWLVGSIFEVTGSIELIIWELASSLDEDRFGFLFVEVHPEITRSATRTGKIFFITSIIVHSIFK